METKTITITRIVESVEYADVEIPVDQDPKQLTPAQLKELCGWSAEWYGGDVIEDTQNYFVEDDVPSHE